MIYKNLSKNFLSNLILVIVIFILDRLSKIYVISMSNENSVSHIFSSKYLNISLIWNEGIAFGLFSFEEKSLYNFLTVIILAVILLILIMIINSNGIKKYLLIMIFSGAIGNLFDRIFYKAVPDFIDCHIGEFHWFIFNVADIFISVGIIFMILFELIDNNKTDDQKI